MKSKIWWEAYYITKTGYCDQYSCNTKREVLKLARELAKNPDNDFVEIRACNGEEILDETMQTIKSTPRAEAE